jgi:galactonate dehydratase
MKIASVEPFTIEGTRSYTEWNLVRVRTDDGIEGIGEGFSFSNRSKQNAGLISGHIAQLGRRLIGTDAGQIQAFVDEAFRMAPENAQFWSSAISAIEIALWDIAGKAAGQPVYEMLGGARRETIPLYADHGVFVGDFDLDRILAAKDAGFEMFKWDPFEEGGNPGEDAIARCAEVVGTVRDAVGPDYKIAIDAHGRFNLEGAKLAARAIEPFAPIFFEDPMPLGEPEGFRELAEWTAIPLATGELAESRDVPQRFLDTGGVAIWQPEVGINGGILETLAVADMYHARGLTVAPHNWCGPVVTRAASHVAAAIPNLLYQEWASLAPEDTWEQDLIEPAPNIVNGRLVLPDAPGLGFQLNEDLIEERRVT